MFGITSRHCRDQSATSKSLSSCAPAGRLASKTRMTTAYPPLTTRAQNRQITHVHHLRQYPEPCVDTRTVLCIYSSLRAVLFWSVSLCTAGVPLLVCRWLPHLRVKATYELSDAASATVVLVQAADGTMTRCVRMHCPPRQLARGKARHASWCSCLGQLRCRHKQVGNI